MGGFVITLYRYNGNFIRPSNSSFFIFDTAKVRRFGNILQISCTIRNICLNLPRKKKILPIGVSKNTPIRIKH